jgi:hypothetical protein
MMLARIITPLFTPGQSRRFHAQHPVLVLIITIKLTHYQSSASRSCRKPPATNGVLGSFGLN